MEKTEENIVKLKGSLLELENLFKEGKDRNDAKVKDVEEKIRIALDIPRECLINSGQTLKDMIESLHKHVDLVQNSPIPSEMIPGKDVLKNASGGLALEGVFKTRKPDDLLVEKEQLIEIPDSFSLTSPKQSTRYEQKEFSSHKSANKFLKIMERVGHYYGLDIGIKQFGLGVEKKTQNETEKTTSSSQEESYILHTKYNYIPLASGSFQRDKLKLSTGAVKALKRIEEISLHSDEGEPQTNLVRCFYERFGSHVHQGPIHLGGIFWWKASSSGFRSSDLSEVKELTSSVLDAYCGAGWMFGALPACGKAAASLTHLSGSLTGKHREDLMSQVHLSVSKTGGPPEIDDYLVWKSHLIANNRTWSVVDRGTTLIPVWEILTASHRDDFRDVSKLSRILLDSYKEITGEHVEEMWGENILSQVEKAEALMQSMKTWIATDCESHLTHLLDFRNRLFKEKGSHTIWFEKCLSNELLQKYLFEVATENRESTAMNTRCLVRSLLEPDLYSIQNFQNRSQIVDWAYQTLEDSNEHVPVTDFPGLEKILHCAKKELEDSRYAFSSPEQEQLARMKVTNTVTLSLNSFCKTLENTEDEVNLLILSVITVIGYNSKCKTFNHLLGINEIRFLQSELHNAFSQYSCLRKQCPVRAQAYLFLTALTVSTNKEKAISSAKKRNRLQILCTDLKDKLSSPITVVLEKMQDDWQSLEKALHSLTLGEKENMEERDEEVKFQLEDVNKASPGCPKKDEMYAPVYDSGEKSKSFLDVLQSLGLEDSYPKKMTKDSVLVINRLSLSVEEPKKERDLSSRYLYKLMMLDYRSRYLFVKPEIGMALEEDSVDDGDDFFDCEDNSDSVVSSKQTQIHPMDLHMAIFHCSNDFLRQYFYTKLSACQFALPFLVPNPCTDELEFPSWALRHIKKSWHAKSQTVPDASEAHYNRQMFNTPVSIVSFFRLGISEFNSKSQILNGVINKQKHDVFFHRHCEGSTPHSLLMDGVVEIAWYCPGGKDDVFDDCVAFLNLHGDAAEHPKQLDFLQTVSTVNVLLLSEHPMSESAKEISQRLSKSPVPLICLFSGKDKIQPSKNLMKVRLAAKNRNQAELTNELISSIKQCINKYKCTVSIEKCCEEARRQKFIVDEDEESCRHAHKQALELMHFLKDIELSTLKETILPLQGKLWHDWCKKNKEQYRMKSKKNKNFVQQETDISSEMKNIRRKQLDKATSLNDFMRSFKTWLKTPGPFGDVHLYMLQWLRIVLDDLITDELALLKANYHSTLSEINPKKKDEASHECPQQNKDIITTQIAATTFGLQHIMREVSQLYETNKDESLPKFGVSMLTSGYPLELMDGDTAHVPLEWITAVLDELIKTLGDRKVLVLSILGLQSSGKSTLLNTMFGLQFAVSAGRCTRGAFMQLLEVDPSISKELGYDFVLIVDTEGLRSLVLNKDSLSHDNELATFIIGIGDVTLINIMGENPSEIQDILQICVQAFLRMKQAKIKPSCIFVHQNVAESTAGDKNMEGRINLKKNLDNMAKMAAKEENFTDIICFNDVIKFDINTQVFYFKSLLMGDPPMAPPNPSYSQDTQKLKTMLLEVAKRQKLSSLFQFKNRVKDLWTALLHENFVFSFRNTMEVMVYSSLEHKYGEWSWTLRKHSLIRQNELEKGIKSNLIKNVTYEDLTEKFDDVYKKLKDDMHVYFEEDKNKETLSQWKEHINLRIQTLKDELIKGILKKSIDLLASKRHRSELEQSLVKYTNKLTEESKRLASTLRTKQPDDEQITEEFNKLWVGMTTEVLESQSPEEPVNVIAVIQAVLYKKFHNQPNILNKVKSEMKEFQFDTEKHCPKGYWRKKWDALRGKSNYENSVKVILSNATDTIETYINGKEKEKKDFDENFIYEMLTEIDKKVTEFENIPQNPKFTSEFRVDLSISLCLKNAPRLQMMHNQYKTANQPLTYLQSQRETYLQSFKNYCKGASSVTIFVDFLCKNITTEVLNTANNETSRHIADEMKNNNPAFNGTRSKLDNHILAHLAEKEDFNLYDVYMDYPELYVMTFIQEKLMEYCDAKNIHIFQNSLENLKNQILLASTVVTTEVSEKKGGASLWLDLFHDKLGKLLVINRDEFRSIENEDIGDWQFFKDRIAISLEEMIKGIKMDVIVLEEEAVAILFEQVQGCWAQCPFCGAICTNTIPNHDGFHSVTFHRCQALTGNHIQNTDNFVINFCTTSVNSDRKFRPPRKGEWIPYRNYRDAGDPYDKWSITGNSSQKNYWKWFVCKFQNELETKHGYRFVGEGEIPEEWKKITKESVLKELELGHMDKE